MSAAKTYAKLVQIGELQTRFVSDDILEQYPKQAQRSKVLHAEAVYRQGYADNPAESEAVWGSEDGPIVAEPDQFVPRAHERILVSHAVYIIEIPGALVNLPPIVVNWLLATHAATTIDSMYRLADDYEKTVMEMYNERTVP